MSLFLRSGFSRVPVIGDNLDDVLGFAYLKDLVRRDFEAPDVEFTQRVEEVMRPASFVPDSKPVDALLSEMQAKRQHVAVVVDEYGGTAGLITIEDVLEEIVGEITDEYDEEEIEVEQLDDGSTRVSSRYPIDDLDELFGFDVEEEDVDSVGGLMAKHLGLVPIPGSSVEAHGLRFTAEDAAGRRNKIGTVLICRIEPAPPAPRRRTPMPEPTLPPEDAKLVTLARSDARPDRRRRGRRGPRRRRPHVRRRDRRPAVAAGLGARGRVAMAVSSGSRGLEAAVVLTDADAVAEADLAVVRDFAGRGVSVHRGDARGGILETTES